MTILVLKVDLVMWLFCICWVCTTLVVFGRLALYNWNQLLEKNGQLHPLILYLSTSSYINSSMLSGGWLAL